MAYQTSYQARHIDPTRVGDVSSKAFLNRIEEIKRIGEKREAGKQKLAVAGGKTGANLLFKEMPARTEAMLSEGGRERYKGWGGFMKWMTDPATTQSGFIQEGIDKGWTAKEADYLRSKMGLRGAFNKYIRPPITKVAGLVSESAYGLKRLPPFPDDDRYIDEKEIFNQSMPPERTLAHENAVKNMYRNAEESFSESLIKQEARGGPRDLMGERYEAGKLKQYTRSKDPSQVTKPPMFDKDTTIMDWWERQDRPIPPEDSYGDSRFVEPSADMSAPHIPFERTPEFLSKQEQFHREQQDVFRMESAPEREGLPTDPLEVERAHWESKGKSLEDVFDRMGRGTADQEWLKSEGLEGGLGKGYLPEEGMDKILKETIIGNTPPYTPFEELPDSINLGGTMGNFTYSTTGEVAEELSSVVAEELGTEAVEEVGTEVAGDVVGEAVGGGGLGGPVGTALDVVSIFRDPDERSFGDIAGKAIKAGAPATGPFAPAVWAVGTLMDLFS